MPWLPEINPIRSLWRRIVALLFQTENVLVSGTSNKAAYACAMATFIEWLEGDTRKGRKAMSSHFLGNCILTALMALFPATVAFGQGTSAGRGISADDLARAVVANELNAQGGASRWMYRVDREEQGKKKTKEVVQTAQGSLDRLVAVDGHPLNGKEEQDERKRLENLVRNPKEEQRFEEAKRKDAEQCKAFFKLISDALLFSYAGRERDLVKLTYRPNPAFQLPSREARVFQQMEGEMWVNDSQRRLTRIRGQLTADVKFAGGLLGHLEKGGHFEVEQRELLPGQWELTFMEVNIKGKALLFKSIAVQEKEYRNDFQTVPDGLTLATAADMLAKQVLVAANR